MALRGANAVLEFAAKLCRSHAASTLFPGRTFVAAVLQKSNASTASSQGSIVHAVRLKCGTFLDRTASRTCSLLRTHLVGENRTQICSVHSSAVNYINRKGHQEPQEWPRYNEIVYPPRQPGEPRRPAEVVHFRANIKYSQKKLWYIACMIRGMSVDEALKQLSFYNRKGAAVAKEVIQEAQEMAVRDHNVEYKSNLWIEDSFVRKAKTVYGFRRHARQRYCRIHYRYSHYLVRLREGRPPKHYYPPRATGHEMLEGYLENMRSRTIAGSL